MKENIMEIGQAYMPIPAAQYVAYQKLTSPPFFPVLGGYQGPTRRYTLDRILNTTATVHALNSDGGMPALLRRQRSMRRPTVRVKLKAVAG